MTKLERKELARNIRHRLADMLGNQWSGALDAAMNEMLLDEIDKFFDSEELAKEEAAPDALGSELAVGSTGGSTDWPLRPPWR